jgi:hypothetical protein
MLTHQVQGRMECLPTVVAMLAGVPKDEVIAWGLDYAGQIIDHRSRFTVWADLTNGGSAGFWPVAIGTINHFLGKGVGQAHREASWLVDLAGGRGFVAVDGAAVCPGPPTPRRPRKLPGGRGLITIRYRQNQHVAAFENGFVFDPAELAPLTYREWKQRQDRRWKVISIQSIPTEVKA